MNFLGKLIKIPKYLINFEYENYIISYIILKEKTMSIYFSDKTYKKNMISIHYPKDSYFVNQFNKNKVRDVVWALSGAIDSELFAIQREKIQ